MENFMIISTPSGLVRGRREEGCFVFRGIPYAAPPVGDRRFRAPAPLEPWEGVRDALEYGHRSVQFPNPGENLYKKEFNSDPRFLPPVGEDCLYLNIWVPEDVQGPIPVGVYVHGGGFIMGAGSNLPFVATELAKKGVIIVTVNYRLGALGFTCCPVLWEEGEVRGNYALWDILAALKWVRDNCAAFGGDPGNVTAFGQSAGAVCLQALSVSGRLEGLAHRLILQSGGGYRSPLVKYVSPIQALACGDILLRALGFGGNWRERESDQAAARNLLRSVPTDHLIPALKTALAEGISRYGLPYGPVIDGELLPENGDRLVERGHYLHVPHILGSTGDDLATAEHDRTPKNSPLHASCIDYAALMEVPAYVYYFDRKLPGDNVGSFHSSELWYVFGSLKYGWRPWTDQDRELSETIMTFWSNFMKTGSPGDHWRPYRPDDPYFEFLK